MSPIIDIHAHVIGADTQRYPRAPIAGEQSGWSRDRPVDREQMLGAMDAAGVARTALVQASTCYGHDNAYVADSVGAHPGRYAGVFSVDVFQPDAVEKIRYWTGRGLAGLRVFIAGHTAALEDLRLDDPRSFPAWRCAEALGIPVCVQMRAPALPQLATVLERFSGVTMVLDHCARPELEDGPPYRAAGSLFRLARHDNLHLKLTTHNVRESGKGKATPETFFARLVEAFGARRIAWGSNFPASEGSLAGILAEAKSALATLAESDRDWIFSRTAQRLYPSLAESVVGAASR
jgi:predicted TIM-barrel fold metal-dependent hydrolase